MKVNDIRRNEAVRTGTTRRTQPGHAGFTVPDEPHVRAAHAAAPQSPIAALDALIALQREPDPHEGRRHAAARGEDMLAMLDQVRLGLLGGTVPAATLQRLQAALRERNAGGGFADPALDALLDAIELRAAVELAKLGVAV